MAGQNKQATRRHFLGAMASGAGLLMDQQLMASDLLRCQPPRPPNASRRKIAVVTTAYHYLSHAYHICGRFLHGYLRDGTMHYPDFAIAGMYVEQPKHPGDLSRDLARDFGFTLHDTVAGALTLGGQRLAVDG